MTSEREGQRVKSARKPREKLFRYHVVLERVIRSCWCCHFAFQPCCDVAGCLRVSRCKVSTSSLESASHSRRSNLCATVVIAWKHLRWVATASHTRQCSRRTLASLPMWLASFGASQTAVPIPMQSGRETFPPPAGSSPLCERNGERATKRKSLVNEKNWWVELQFECTTLDISTSHSIILTL